MFNNNTSYQEAINAPSRRITGNVTIKGQKLSDDISSIDYVSSISGNTLTIGATNASTVDIKFKKLIEGLAERELIKVSFSVQTSSGIVERQIGEFFLTEIKLDRNNKTTTLKAIDKMAFLNDKYTSTLLYPTLGRNIVQEIANSCNLRVNNNLNITNLPSFSKKLEKVTYREMLGYLAQTVGAFVIFNNNGELEFRKLNRTQKQISKGSYLLKGLEVDEVEYRINGISISLNNQEKTILAVGSPLGTQVKLTNPLMTQGWLNSIFSEYSRLRFNPFKLNWRGDPFVEVGDWVSIEIANGSYRAFPILELKLSYSGGLKSTIGANVKGTTTSTTEYKGTVERQIEFINARLGASGNYVYADTVEPTNPKEGDTWFKPNGAFTDLYIYENNQWVLKTSTGNIEGLITKITDSSVSTQNLATAIAKIIELDAARITTGSLTFEQLSSNTVSEIRKGMVSETKFNSFVNDSNGLRQQMSSEIERVVESKKSTLKGQDGTSSYIHRKYSDNANGTPMSDNSNLKYIGIYTGNKQQAPTNASEYSWTKIRGEDGAKGRDGVDGKSINRNYIIDSDKLTNINSGGTNWEKTVENGTLVFTKVRATESTGIWTQIMPILKDNFQNEVLTWSVDVKASKNISFNNVGQETNGFKGRVDITTQWQRISHTFTNRYTQHYAFVFYQMIGTCSPGDKVYVRLPKLEKGNVATEWSPAYEDLRGRDGVSNYIHRKYSDSSNGANMDDNSNRKYIGIYTGTSPTPPTTASSYLWSKIKGEDGANGVPGAKGADGRTPYFHTAYSNSPTGDRDFSTINSNDKLYIGTYSDFEVADSNDYRRYKWVKIKGEDGRNGVSSYIYRKYSDNANGSPMSDNSNLKYIGIYTGTSATAPTTPTAYTWSKIKGEDGQQGVPGARGSDGRTSYLHTAYSNSGTGDRDFSTTNSTGKEYIGTYTDFEINDSNDYRRYKWIKIKGENGRNGTDGHTLTANLRLEGGYLNNVTNDVKAYLDVFYDGQKITDGFNARVKFKGGIQNTWSNFWDAKVDNTGFLTNVSWGNKEQAYPIALELIALVTYKNLNTVANARLDNLPDVRLINETVKKYKTFESTLEGFTSVVGEIDTKVFSKSYFKNNLNSEDVEKTGNDLYFNTKENLQANEFYTILADLDNVPANQQAYIYSASDGGDKKTIQNGLNYWVVKYTTNQTRINLYPLGTNTKVKNVRIYKGDFRVKKDDERENLYSDYGHDDKGFLHLILNKNKINGNVYLVKFDASNFSNGARWDVYNRVGYNQENLTQVFKTKDNEFTFTINDNTTADRMYLRIAAGTSPDISNVEIYDVTLGYAKNKEVSKLESSIKQTKDEIDLKVSKDNVIAAINASVETTGEGPAQGVVKINADKVDIRGVLSAYTGLIGGFRIGRNPNDGGFWLTGQSNFDCGINPGHNAGSNGAQLWAAWGNLWTSAGPNAWWVTAQGIMVCKNTPTFHKGMEVYGRYIDMHGNDIQGDKSGGGKTTVVWWSQINKANSSSSDKRLKTNIKPTKVKALDTLNNIEMVEFVWKKDGKFEKIGAIAQQVQKVEESFIVNDMDDKQTYNDYLRIKYYDTIPYLIKGIQELSTENQQLKSQIKEMNERLTKLEDKINGNL